MCAIPSPESPAPPRPRITPIQWVGLAVFAVLVAYQLGLFREGGFLGRGEDLVPFLVTIIAAVTIHEFSHAAVATMFGDDLPRRMGRLSLNPLRHLDLMGSLLFLVAGFGWGKPVPINPGAMRNPSLGWALSSIAGPVSNLVSATVVMVLFVLVAPSLGGSAREGAGDFVLHFLRWSIVLGVFNLVPLPPLDGFGFVYGLSPGPLKIALIPVHQYGPWILLALLFLPQVIPGFPPLISQLVGAGAQLVQEVILDIARSVRDAI